MLGATDPHRSAQSAEQTGRKRCTIATSVITGAVRSIAKMGAPTVVLIAVRSTRLLTAAPVEVFQIRSTGCTPGVFDYQWKILIDQVVQPAPRQRNIQWLNP